jgi:hypothetical protein
VALSDGSVLVMGGVDGTGRSDVWKSVNGGVTWTVVTLTAGWGGMNIYIPSLHNHLAYPPRHIAYPSSRRHSQ